MAPQEKAEELVNKFKDNLFVKRNVRIYTEDAIECALIAVDVILESSPSLPILGEGGTYGEDIELSLSYWKQVKHEIINI